MQYDSFADQGIWNSDERPDNDGDPAGYVCLTRATSRIIFHDFEKFLTRIEQQFIKTFSKWDYRFSAEEEQILK